MKPLPTINEITMALDRAGYNLSSEEATKEIFMADSYK